MSHAVSSSYIWVTFQREGIHHYPAAATREDLEDVNFLGHPHRHVFHFKVWLEVTHDDRDVEFIQFKRWIESLYSGGTIQMNHKSCEMIARELSLHIHEKYPQRNIRISVSEDNENGAELEWIRQSNEVCE